MHNAIGAKRSSVKVKQGRKNSLNIKIKVISQTEHLTVPFWPVLTVVSFIYRSLRHTYAHKK